MRTPLLFSAWLLLGTVAIAQVPSYVPTNALIGWWPFNGNANDESGNGFNGTVNGATLTNDRNGMTDAAYSFNGLSDYIETTAQGPIGSTARTIAFWVRTSNVTIQTPVDYYGGIGGAFQPILNNPCPGIGVDAGTGVVTRGDASLMNGSWHHCAVVFDPDSGSTISEVVMYIDGIEQVSITCSALDPNVPVNTVSTLPVLFAKTTSNVRYVDGDLDDIGIWNRALSPCEVQTLYLSGEIGLSSDPVSFTGLNSGYSTSDPPSILSGTPAGGLFIGPGISGNTFDPALAGEGTHGITYMIVDACGAVNAASACASISIGMGLEPGTTSTSAVRVYPNPNQGQFTVELELSGLVSLQVFDARGRQVHNEVFQASGAKILRNLDLSKLTMGTYTLTVRNAGAIVSQRVVLE